MYRPVLRFQRSCFWFVVLWVFLLSFAHQVPPWERMCNTILFEEGCCTFGRTLTLALFYHSIKWRRSLEKWQFYNKKKRAINVKNLSSTLQAAEGALNHSESHTRYALSTPSLVRPIRTIKPTDHVTDSCAATARPVDICCLISTQEADCEPQEHVSACTDHPWPHKFFFGLSAPLI